MLFGALLQTSGLALLCKPSLQSFRGRHFKSKPSSPSLEYGYQDGACRINSPGRYEGRDLHKIAAGQIRGCSLALGYIFLEPGYRFIITQPSTEHNDRSLKRVEEHFHFISACVSHSQALSDDRQPISFHRLMISCVKAYLSVISIISEAPSMSAGKNNENTEIHDPARH